jgi:hypothetical protein
MDVSGIPNPADLSPVVQYEMLKDHEQTGGGGAGTTSSNAHLTQTAMSSNLNRTIMHKGTSYVDVDFEEGDDMAETSSHDFRH